MRLNLAAVPLASTALRALLRLPSPVLAAVAAAAPHAVGVDLQARVVLALGRLGQRATGRDPAKRSVAAARREMAIGARLLAPVAPAGVRVEDATLATATGPLAVRIFRPAHAPAPAPALVYCHGGGFLLGDLDTHDPSCRALAAATGAVVVSVAYRLAPEHPFPAGRDDVIAAFRAVARDAARLGLDPARLGIGGDSAGGNLAALVALATRADPISPKAQLLVYPVVDLTRASPSLARLAKGFFLERATMDWFTALYAPDPGVRAEPGISPIFADVAGAPPAIVVTCGFDPLVDEGTAYAERLAAAGVATQHLHYPTLYHGFAALTGGIAAADRAMHEVFRALRVALFA